MDEAHSELEDATQEEEEELLVSDEAYPADYQDEDPYSYYTETGYRTGYSYGEYPDYEPCSYTYEDAEEPTPEGGETTEDARAEKAPSVTPSAGSGRAGKHGPREVLNVLPAAMVEAATGQTVSHPSPVTQVGGPEATCPTLRASMATGTRTRSASAAML